MLNIFQDISYDVAHIIQYAARVYDDMVSTISAMQFFECELFEFEYKPNSIHMRRTTSSDIKQPDEQKDIESQWCIVQDVDWTYDDSLRVDNSASI
jgi:hypothetical protein